MDDDGGTGSGGSTSVTSDAPLVLLVDDSEAMRYSYARILERAGFRVVSANTANGALEALASHSPHVVLLDVVMPDCDGIETMMRMRSNAATRTLPIVAFSAYLSPTDAHNLRLIGFDEVLLKSAAETTLLDVVKRFAGA